MSVDVFLKALFAGLVFGLPAGPAGILVLRSWLTKKTGGRWGATSGMAAADGLVVSMSLWGLSVLPPLWMDSLQALRPVAGAVLIGTGLGFLFFEKDEKRLGGGGAFWGSFFWPVGLVLTNPGIWAAYAAFLVALGAFPKSLGVVLVAGIGASMGVCLLWGALGSLVIKWKEMGQFDEQALTRWADRASGILLTIFGVWGLFF